MGAGKVFSPHDIWNAVFEIPYKIAIDANKKKVDTWGDTDWYPVVYTFSDYLPFIDKGIDLVIATDFIEHLTPEVGLQFLVEADRVCSKAIILFTPMGFLDTEKYQREHVHSSLDLHHSGWQPWNFTSFGFEVEIIENMHNFGDVHFNGIWAWKVY